MRKHVIYVEREMWGKLAVLLLLTVFLDIYRVSADQNVSSGKLAQYSEKQNNGSETDDRVADVSGEPVASSERQLQKDTDCYETDPSRPLSAGDILTPPELLPVAERLIAKVEDPGLGKGIVSSAKSPQHLADTLFERFFLTKKRIVTLNAYDITGLDALQALALSGQDANIGIYTKSTTESVEMINFNGQNIGVDTEPKKSKYTLLMKNNNLNIKKKIVLKHAGDVNSIESLKNNPTEKAIQGLRGKPSNPVCTWKYVCSNPDNLDTCLLHQECSRRFSKNSKKSAIDSLGISHRPDEHTAALQQFRKMLGITIVDEEVEKIIENRVLLLTPQYGENKALARLEPLSEYFNNIIMAEQTTQTHTWYNKDPPHGSSQEHQSQNSTTGEDSQSILGIPTIPSAKPHEVIN